LYLYDLSSESEVTLYRVGDFIDVSCGPLMSNTGHVGRVSITSAHNLSTDDSGRTLTRIQGVAIPDVILVRKIKYNLVRSSYGLNFINEPFIFNFIPQMNHFNYSIVEARAKKLVK